jgi:hypothetical protein
LLKLPDGTTTASVSFARNPSTVQLFFILLFEAGFSMVSAFIVVKRCLREFIHIGLVDRLM